MSEIANADQAKRLIELVTESAWILECTDEITPLPDGTGGYCFADVVTIVAEVLLGEHQDAVAEIQRLADDPGPPPF